MIIFSSRGRPHNLARFLQAYRDTGATAQIMVRVDTDDPSLPEYGEIAAVTEDIPLRVIDGPRIGAARGHNDLFKNAPDEPWYACLADDVVPKTAGWDRILADACMGGLAYGADGFQNAHLPTHAFIDGRVARALGWLALPFCRHYFADNAWMVIGQSLQHLRYVPEVTLEHMHPLAGKAPLDATYTDAGAMDADGAAFKRWFYGRMFAEMGRLRVAMGKEGVAA